MSSDPHIASPALLCAADPTPVELVASGRAPVLLTCDHASCVIPRSLHGLGLPEGAVQEHIGWDIGAAAVTRRLAPVLGATAVLAGYSRLVIDCNRDPDDPSSIPPASDGVAVPGNRDLSAAKRMERVECCFVPYHTAIATRIGAMLAAGAVPALISIHSFTPIMKGIARPWHVGILWDRDARIAEPLLAALRAEFGDAVGDNQPYSAREPPGYTQRHHGAARGLPHVAIELRQDLVATDARAAAWAARLAAALAPILARPEIHRIEQY